MPRNNQPNTRGGKKVTPARRAAWEILTIMRTGSKTRYVHDVANDYFKTHKLPQEERAFALLLASGVVSTCGSLDKTINSILKSPTDVNANVRDALRISAYELLFLEKQSHAAVDQGVELVRSIAPKATGVANFVLRRVAKKAPVSVDAVQLEGVANNQHKNAQNGAFLGGKTRADGVNLPTGNVATLKDFEALADAQGFPVWILETLARSYSFAWVEEFARYSNTAAPVYFMINQAHRPGAEVLKSLVEAGIAIKPVTPLAAVSASATNAAATAATEAGVDATAATEAGVDAAATVATDVCVSEASFPAFQFAQRSSITHPLVEQYLAEGTLIISDHSAQTVVSLALPQVGQQSVQPLHIGPYAVPQAQPSLVGSHAVSQVQPSHARRQQPHSADSHLPREHLSREHVSRGSAGSCNIPRMLEIASGRGSKTIMLQEAAKNRFGAYLCLETLEISAQKSNVAAARMKQAGIPVAAHYVQDARDLSGLQTAAYNAVFIDAPCSGAGTLRRHPEIRWRLKPEDLQSLSAIGSTILQQASRLVAPGGQLTYATCSAFAQENEQVIRQFLQTEAGQQFRVEHTFKTPLVMNGPDVHFACVLRLTGKC